MLKNIFKFREFGDQESNAAKVSKLTNEERAKIIEEEALRAEIRRKTDPVANEIDAFVSTLRVGLFILALVMAWYVWSITK